jgi:hypothetical protein
MRDLYRFGQWFLDRAIGDFYAFHRSFVAPQFLVISRFR